VQLRICHEVLMQYPDALLLGDFNFDSERNFSPPPHVPLENAALANIMPEFVDVWPALRHERGLTFNSDLNPYIGKPEHMRYDRIITRLASWQVQSIDMFGDEPMDQFRELSDWEQDHANRPPTPTRPQPRPRRDPFSFEQSDDEGQTNTTDGGASAQEPASPRARSRFFLSDHFGLIASLVRTSA
jgi:hypothetical protein